MLLEETAMNAKMDTLTLFREMVAKVVIAIQLEVLILHANDLVDNAIVNQELLGIVTIISTK